jgi:SAM-dependent methyltransferase
MPLHSKNPIGRFDDRAADYVKYRPDYPRESVDAILEGLPAPSSLHAADVGAGTGISARLLGDRGVQVIAVEPGAAMRNAAAPHPKVQWVAARAEATGLDNGSVDIVVCAQSFHWFQPDNAIAEFARILRSGGRLAIMWNRRSQTDPLTRGYRDALLEVGGEEESERMPFDPSCITRNGSFRPPVRHLVPYGQTVDLDGFIGRARSASYAPKSGPEGERLLTLLRDLHARFADADGNVRLVYDTELFLATRI